MLVCPYLLGLQDVHESVVQCCRGCQAELSRGWGTAVAHVRRLERVTAHTHTHRVVFHGRPKAPKDPTRHAKASCLSVRRQLSQGSGESLDALGS